MIKQIGYRISYYSLRTVGFLISLLSYRAIHAFGRILGILAYYCHVSFRKKAMTNLAIAKDLALDEKEMRRIAKESFQTLAITCLEFFRLKKSKGQLSELVSTPESHEIFELLKSKQGTVFLTAHQANWEIPFLFITDTYPGIAIGRPIKNRKLYNWILSVREMNQGKIVMPRNAIKEGLRALKAGKFIGIVGDQAFPDSGYSYPLFGTRAWTATTPAILAYRTNTPLVVGIAKREGSKYKIDASPPLWPDQSRPMKEEVSRMMDAAMGYLEKSIREKPGQWLWQHDRWKQTGIDHVKRKYRYGFVLVILPPDLSEWIAHLPVFREIYSRSFLSVFAPKNHGLVLPDWEIHTYDRYEDLFVRDWRYQIVFDFYDSGKLRSHFRKLGAFQVLNLKKLHRIADSSDVDHSRVLKLAICKQDARKQIL